MASRPLEIDPEQAETFRGAAAEIATVALNGLSKAARMALADKMQQGSIYLHVQLHPAFAVVLAFDPYAENLPPIELARWQDEAPDAIRAMLN